MGASLKNKILPLQKQIETKNRWLKNRLDNLLPQLMSKASIDMWVVIAKEYNEDPAMLTLFPASMMNAPRTTGLVMCRVGGNVKRYNLFSKYGSSMKPYYEPAWDDKNETQLECLKCLVKEFNPKTIGLNYSGISGLMDGISKTMYDDVTEALGEFADRVVSAEELCRMWMETRTQEELTAYEGINYIMDSIIDEVFSCDTIHPGVTSTDDLEWIFKDKIHELGLRMSFWCDVDLQRAGVTDNTKVTGVTIMPGDIIRCDVGCEYLGLHTDTQKLVYVLGLGEDDAPDSLKCGLKQCNEFQDIVCSCITEGKTGNEVLIESLGEAARRGIRADLYTHPIGTYVHGAGPIFGLWDKQEPLKGVGELRINADTCYALELLTRYFLPEWNQEIEVFAEQLIGYTKGHVYYIGRRQTELILVK